MKVTAIGMVKDEADIIQYTIENFMRQGVTSFIVSDNMSTDGTKEVLQRYSAVEYLYDDIVGYYQSEKMTWMAERAFADGADWVIPFDADEEWVWKEGKPLFDYLKIMEEVTRYSNVFLADICNHIPTYMDSEGVDSPFERITQCIDSDPRFKKVILHKKLKGTPFTIDMGNHGVTGESVMRFECEELVVHHYPWRSPEQYLKKITNGYNAYYNSTLFGKYGTHWTERRNPAEYPDDVVTEFYDKYFVGPTYTGSTKTCHKEYDEEID